MNRIRSFDLCQLTLSGCIAFLISVTTCIEFAAAQMLPDKVSVLPVFVIPKGERPPTNVDKLLLMKHLKWSQQRYREMLGNRDTFQFEPKPDVFRSKFSIDQFKKGNAADLVTEELLAHYKTDRYSCKYVFLALFANPGERYPGGGGRPINGGINTGGGIVVISTNALRTSKNFQSTLQHELGHSFGLTHVDAYGYHMKRNASIMSYNPSHHTNEFQPSKTPGSLIPEDVRSLALNDRVFSKLEFNNELDLPNGYEIKPIRILGPMSLPDNPMILVETSNGEINGSSVQNVVHSRIRPSLNRGKIEYDQKTMWHSSKLDNGIASLTLTFPMPVSLDRIHVYSQHSGKHHEATAIRISTRRSTGKWREVTQSSIEVPDEEVVFKKTNSKNWKIELKAGESNVIVVRGLRFYDGERELFPPLVPMVAEK